jgi:hypothetical protein
MMLGNELGGPKRTVIRIRSEFESGAWITFEPIGTRFEVAYEDHLTLELDVDVVGELEYVTWPNGMAVWVPYEGDYIVRDSAGNELDRL